MVSNGRSQTFVCFHCPLVAQQWRNPPACGKNRLRLKDQLLGRAHLARHSIDVEKSKAVGALPQTPPEALPLDSARGIAP